MGWWTDRRRALAAALAVACAAAPAPAQQVVVDSYQQEQGLANLTAQCITQDARGTVWVCTANGLFRLDGFRVHKEPLPDRAGSWILAVRAGLAGRLWVAAIDGLFVGRPDGTAYRWDEVRAEDGAALLLSAGQRLEVDSAGTAYAMDRDSVLWKVVSPADDAQAVVAQRLPLPAYEPWPPTQDASGGPLHVLEGGVLWFGCGEALCEWRDDRLRRWGEQDGVPRRNWASFVLERDGSLWVRSADVLLRLSPGAQRFEAIAAPPARRWDGTIAMVQDSAGHIVTATDDGLATWDGHQWRHWTPRRNGLPETVVRSLMIDAEGSLWFGTSGRGLHRWIGWGKVEHWTVADGLPHPVVWGSARDRLGRLWVATSHGIARFDAKAGRFHLVPGSSDSRIAGLYADAAGNIWWKQGDSAVVAPAGGDKAHTIFTDVGAHIDLAQGGQGQMYVLGNRRVHKLVSQAGRFHAEVLIDNPNGDRFWGVVNDGTQDWFVSARGLYRREAGAWKPLLDEQGRPVDAYSYAAFSPQDAWLWVVDAKGVSAYALKDGAAHRIHRFSNEQLGGIAPGFLQASPDGGIWLGTDRGVLIYQDGHWSRLDRGNGLLWNDVSDHALRFDADGTAWIGTSAGLTQVRPGWRPQQAPRLRLDGLQFGTHWLREPPREAVAWDNRYLRVTVGTADYGSAHSMRIEYRLDSGGGPSGWRELTGNTLQIDSLQAGWHALEMRAIGLLGVEQAGPPLHITFEVAPPWWLSLPAMLGYVLLLAALLALSIFVTNLRARRRSMALERAVAERTVALHLSQQALRQLGEHNARALEEERKHVSRELHDEMGQQLAALRMEVSVLGMRARSQQLPRPEQLDMLLGRVDRLVTSVRGLVQQLRPPALDGGLAAALDWLADEFTRNTGIPCRLDIDRAACDLSPDQATMLFRIAQESLTNVRRHAHATQLVLSLQRQEEEAVLTVSDNGVGFDAAQRREGHGLLGMQERARLLGGELTVTSTPGAGTTVRLRIQPAPTS